MELERFTFVIVCLVSLYTQLSYWQLKIVDIISEWWTDHLFHLHPKIAGMGSCTLSVG